VGNDQQEHMFEVDFSTLTRTSSPPNKTTIRLSESRIAMSYASINDLLEALKKYDSLVQKAVEAGKVDDFLKDHGKQIVSIM
jgi:hypothetical protein